MHTVHYPNVDATEGEPFIAAAMGVMFSVENYDKSVTEE